MPSLNQILVMGHLGKDPELSQVGEYQKCTFSLATSEYIKQQNQTTWHNIELWGKSAEAAANKLKRGSLALILGRQEHAQYTDRNGVKKTWSFINGRQFRALDRDTPTAEQPSDYPADAGVDEIPF